MSKKRKSGSDRTLSSENEAIEDAEFQDISDAEPDAEASEDVTPEPETSEIESATDAEETIEVASEISDETELDAVDEPAEEPLLENEADEPDQTATMAGMGAVAAGAVGMATEPEIAADPEPVAQTPEREVVRETVVEKRGGVVHGLIGGLIGGAAVYFGAPAILPMEYQPEANIAPVEARIAEAETVASEASTRLSELTELGTRMEELSEVAAATDEKVSSLANEVTRLDGLATELQAADSETSETLTASIDSVANDVNARVEGVQSALADVSTDGEQVAAQVLELLSRTDALEKRPIAESNDALASAAVGAYSREMTALRQEIEATRSAAEESVARAEATNTETSTLLAETREAVLAEATSAREETVTLATEARDEAVTFATEARDAATAAAEKALSEAQALAAQTKEETAAMIAATKEEVAATAAAARAEVEAQAREAAAKAEAEAAAAAAAASLAEQKQAFAEVRSALSDGSPFAEQLAVITDVDVPEPLIAASESGVATLESLQSGFGPVARDALAAARSGAQSEDPAERGVAFLQRRLGVRSLDAREGDSADAVLSRAQAAVTNGNLEDAITEIDALPETAVAEMADWVTQAQTRVDAVAGADALAAALAAK